MVSFHPPVAAQMLAVGESASAATTLHKRRLRLTSLRLALANSSVKSSGMGARGHAHPVKTPVSNAYRFISGNFQLRPEPSKHVPKFVYKDQGIAPGNGFKTIFSANGAAHQMGIWVVAGDPGRCPGLMGLAPLVRRVFRANGASTR